MQGGVIKKDAMGVLTVLPQSFAVVAYHYDDGVLQAALLINECDQLTKSGVGIGDLPVIEIVSICCSERLGWLVRIVRVIQVHPNESRSIGMRFQPCGGVLNDFVSASLNASPARLRRSLCRKTVIEIEALIKTDGQRLVVQDHGADERRGLVSSSLEGRGDGGVRRSKRHAEVGHAVRTRIKSRENAGVRGVSDGRGGVGMGEVRAHGAEAIECWRLNFGIS